MSVTGDSTSRLKLLVPLVVAGVLAAGCARVGSASSGDAHPSVVSRTPSPSPTPHSLGGTVKPHWLIASPAASTSPTTDVSTVVNSDPTPVPLATAANGPRSVRLRSLLSQTLTLKGALWSTQDVGSGTYGAGQVRGRLPDGTSILVSTQQLATPIPVAAIGDMAGEAKVLPDGIEVIDNVVPGTLNQTIAVTASGKMVSVTAFGDPNKALPPPLSVGEVHAVALVLAASG